MSRESILQIMAVSLESSSRYKMYAAFDGDRLAVTHGVPITGAASEWRQALIEEIQDRVSKGFVVLIEDRTETISQHGTKYLFDDVEEGRTNLYHALDWYFAMDSLGSILVDESLRRYTLRSGVEGSMIEKRQDDKGRVVYDVQWGAFSGAHKAMLMCVVAAKMEPLSERFLAEMFQSDGLFVDKQPDASRSFYAITVQHDRDRFEEYEKQFMN